MLFQLLAALMLWRLKIYLLMYVSSISCMLCVVDCGNLHCFRLLHHVALTLRSNLACLRQAPPPSLCPDKITCSSTAAPHNSFIYLVVGIKKLEAL